VAARTEREVQALAAGCTGRRPRVVEDPGEAAGEETETTEGEGQNQQRPSHSGGRD
jgi:hypothetical protein